MRSVNRCVLTTEPLRARGEWPLLTLVTSFGDETKLTLKTKGCYPVVGRTPPGALKSGRNPNRAPQAYTRKKPVQRYT